MGKRRTIGDQKRESGGERLRGDRKSMIGRLDSCGKAARGRYYGWQ
jgi:hypothetical protein